MFEMNDSKINYANHDNIIMQVDVQSQNTEDALYSLLVWYRETLYSCYSACDIYIAAYVDSGNTYLKVRLFNNYNINVEYHITYHRSRS